jgi:hypothetical protein
MFRVHIEMNNVKILRILLLPFLLAAIPLAASADPWKDESGHGRHGHGNKKFKEEYRDGNCTVKRKFDKHGEYEEERKCKGQHYSGYGHAPVYVAPPSIVIDPGLTIHGTVTIRP